MVTKVEPQVFLIGETSVVDEGLSAYLDAIGVPEWETNAPSDGEMLAEVAGRLCYLSFEPGLNRNVQKIRKGNKTYLENIIGQKHGSVLEHACVNFIFHNVSRVFTHELVRHRVGTSISQESLRYVRLTNLKFWMPNAFKNYPEVQEKIYKLLVELEEFQIWMAEHFGLDEEGQKFGLKKLITSAMRRVAPIGLGTSIMWGANFRTLRHVIEMRTSEGAEEEARFVFGQVAEICAKRYPNAFQDMTSEMVGGYLAYKFEVSKI